MAKRNQNRPAEETVGQNNDTHRNPHPGLTHEADSRRLEEEKKHRSGSDSNAHKHRKDSQAHHHTHHQPHSSEQEDDSFNQDLTGNYFAGENHGQRDPDTTDYSNTAQNIKDFHTRLSALTDDQLSNLVIVTQGTRLEQGAKYIDLKHLENGEFVATASMVAGPENSYVAKKETDYVLWNILNQVDEPARVDREDSPTD